MYKKRKTNSSRAITLLFTTIIILKRYLEDCTKYYAGQNKSK
jgi:hypothetical protein